MTQHQGFAWRRCSAEAAEEITPPSIAAPAPTTEIADDGDELDMFRFSLRMDKLDFVKKAMGLNEKQEKKFLHQYYIYDTEMKKLNDERLAIIKD